MGTAIITALNSFSQQADLDELSSGWKLGTLHVPSFAMPLVPITYTSLPIFSAEMDSISDWDWNQGSYASSRVNSMKEIYRTTVPFTAPIKSDIFAFQLGSKNNYSSDNNPTIYNVNNSFQVFNTFSANISISSLTSYGTLLLGLKGMFPAFRCIGYARHSGDSTSEKYRDDDGTWQWTSTYYNCTIWCYHIGLASDGVVYRITAARLTKYNSSRSVKSEIEYNITMPELTIPYWYL